MMRVAPIFVCIPSDTENKGTGSLFGSYSGELPQIAKQWEAKRWEGEES